MSNPITSLKILQTKNFYDKFTNFIFVGFNNVSNIKTTSILFDLHSRITPLILLSGVIFLSLNEYFGEAITCLTSKSDISKELIEKYCWMEGSFVTFKRQIDDYYYNESDIGYEQAYPGVQTDSIGNRKFYTKYYQWVYFILIIQSLLFYLPKRIWELREGVKIEEVCKEINKKPINELDKTESKKIIQDVYDLLIVGSNTFSLYNQCESFFLVNLIGQIVFTQFFLGNTFFKLGYQWLLQKPQDLDPLTNVFPRLTKCSFHVYGYSGSIETKDSLCFLPLNIVNEKIYLTLWFWFCFLLTFTLIYFLIRAFTEIIPSLRYKYLIKQSPLIKKSIAFQYSRKLGFWFILIILSNNMKPSYFADLIENVNKINSKTILKKNNLLKLSQIDLEKV